MGEVKKGSGEIVDIGYSLLSSKKKMGIIFFCPGEGHVQT